MKTEIQALIEQEEMIIRATSTSLDSLACLRDILASRRQVAKAYLNATDNDVKNHCVEMIGYLNSQIKLVIF